jgi:hypothetical protein
MTEAEPLQTPITVCPEYIPRIGSGSNMGKYDTTACWIGLLYRHVRRGSASISSKHVRKVTAINGRGIYV